MQRSPPIVVPRGRVHAMPNEKACEFDMSTRCRDVQRSPPIISPPSPGHRVRTVLDEEAYDIHISLFRRKMQRRPPAVDPHRCVSAMLVSIFRRRGRPGVGFYGVVIGSYGDSAGWES
jgi:hypothetical protein